MSKFCPMCNEVTNCTENCKHCFEEEAKEEEIKCQNTQNLKPNTKPR